MYNVGIPMTAAASLPMARGNPLTAAMAAARGAAAADKPVVAMVTVRLMSFTSLMAAATSVDIVT